MAATESAEDTRRTDDEALLHRLGYAQVLYREMGGFSNFAISFTIISILAGCLTSYYLAFNNGGPVAITWGWLLVGAFCVLVSMAMGEIASAMPTAGALYFWASKLGGPAWGWFTGWFNLVGEIAVTASIQYGSAIFTTALLNIWFPAMGTETGTIFIVFTVIVALQLALNLLNINVLAMLNSVSAWWHMGGVLVIVAVLALVPENHQSVGFVFGEVINNSGFSDSAIWFVFGLGLLMSQYTITGYDASAHMSEETRQASRTAALGMVMAVVASVVFGFILLVAVTFAVPDVQGTLDAAGDAVVYIWTESLGETWAAFLLLIAVIAQLFCGTASVTASSRMMFAFSRDRAVPFSGVWRKVASNRAPVNAVTAICVLSWALMLPTLVNGVLGYAVGTSIAVIGLYIAFALPIILRIKAGSRFEPGAWSLGERYKWISTIAVVWIAIVCILFLMPLSPAGVPFSAEFDWEAMNYAPLTVFGALVLFGGWYLISARNWFTGPVPEGGLEELQTIEQQLESEAHGKTGPGAATAPVAAAAGAAAAAAVAVAATTDGDTAKAEADPAENDTAEDAEKDTADDSEKDAAEDNTTADDAEKDTAEAAAEATAEDVDGSDPAADAADGADADTADTGTAGTAASAETGGEAGENPGDEVAADGTEESATDAPAGADEAEQVDEKAADESDAETAEGTAEETAEGDASAEAASEPAGGEPAVGEDGDPAVDSAEDSAEDSGTAPAAASAAVTAVAAAEATEETASQDTATQDTATDEVEAGAPAETGSAAAPEPAVDAAGGTGAGPDSEPAGGDAAAPVRTGISPEIRAELKEELKAELKAELLKELRAEVATTGLSSAALTGAQGGSGSGSPANGKVDADPTTEPDAETPAK